MKPHRLKVGAQIPDFWTRDINGEEVDPRNLKNTTLFVFLRYAGCPFCNLAVYRLTHEYKLLKKNGCDVIAFIQSTEESIEEHVIAQQKITPPFPIVPDQQQDIYKLFGVRSNPVKAAKYTAKNASHWVDAVFKKKFKQTSFDGSSFLVPAYFLVNKDGVVQLANYDASFYEDEVFTPIYEHLTFGPKT
jgi:peroxiredoxin